MQKYISSGSPRWSFTDTKEYQDFLQMYTDKTKTQETGIIIVKII
jgi:hypothetical protein